jgi:hypothetical protein
MSPPQAQARARVGVVAGLPLRCILSKADRQSMTCGKRLNVCAPLRTVRGSRFRSSRSRFRSTNRPETRTNAGFPQFRSFRSANCRDRQGQALRVLLAGPRVRVRGEPDCALFADLSRGVV